MKNLEKGKFFDCNEFVNSSMSFGSLCLYQEQISKEIESLNTIFKNMLNKVNSYVNLSLYKDTDYKKMNSIFSEIDDNEFFTFNEKQEVRLSIAKIYCYTILVSWYNIIDIRSSDIKSSIYEIFSRIDDVDKIIIDFSNKIDNNGNENLLLLLLEELFLQPQKENLFDSCSKIITNIFSTVGYLLVGLETVDLSDVYKEIEKFINKYQSEVESSVDILKDNCNSIYKKIENYYLSKIKYYNTIFELIDLMKDIRKGNSLNQIMLLQLENKLDLLGFDPLIVKNIMSKFQLKDRKEQISNEKNNCLSLEKVVVKTPKEVLFNDFENIERRLLRLRRLIANQFKANLYQVENEFRGRKQELEEAIYLSDEDIEIYKMSLFDIEEQLKKLEEEYIIPETSKVNKDINVKGFILFDTDSEMNPYICNDIVSSFVDNGVNLGLGYEDFNKIINDLIGNGEMEIISSNSSSVSDVTHYCMLPVYYDKNQRNSNNATGLIRLKPRKNSNLRFVCREVIFKKDSEIYSQVVNLLVKIFPNIKIDANENFKFIMNFATGLKMGDESLYSEAIKRYDRSCMKKLLLDSKGNVKQRLTANELSLLEDLINVTLNGYYMLQKRDERFEFNMIDDLMASNPKNKRLYTIILVY